MIRLDGNSLAAFRGAGVAGTVQSVAGCELFGARRSPLWASPYSAAATAALKAQFSAEQWATIRDYGFSHPEYIAAINFAAPQDPEIMYSLIPTLGKVRKLVGDGTAYLSIPIAISTLDRVKIEIENRETASSYQPFFDTSTYSLACWLSSSSAVTTLTGTEDMFNCSQGEHIFEKIGGAWYVDGVQKQTKNITETIYDGFVLFSWSGTKSRVNKGAMKSAVLGNDGSEKFIGVPCEHNGENGMLDTVHAIWYGNANSSGSFTISESPA